MAGTDRVRRRKYDNDASNRLPIRRTTRRRQYGEWTYAQRRFYILPEIRDVEHPELTRQSNLEEWDLIEEVGRVNQSGGIPERVFGLTDKGREFVEDYLTEEREQPDSYEIRIERLEDEVSELQTINERLEAKVDQQREHLTDLENRFDTLLDRLEDQLF